MLKKRVSRDLGRVTIHTNPVTCVCPRERLIETGLGSRVLFDQESSHSQNFSGLHFLHEMRVESGLG